VWLYLHAEWCGPTPDNLITPTIGVKRACGIESGYVDENNLSWTDDGKGGQLLSAVLSGRLTVRAAASHFVAG